MGARATKNVNQMSLSQDELSNVAIESIVASYKSYSSASNLHSLVNSKSESTISRYSMKSASSASYSSSSLNSALSATTRQEHYDNKHKKLKEKAKSLATITTKENKILTFEKNQLINGRYSLTAVLGEGTFGKVFAAVDSFTKKLVALKIITNREHDETAKNEVEILEKLSRLGPTAKRLFVEMIDYQFFSSHSLIVFEMLGFSIYDYQKQKDFEPYPIINIRDIGYQICYAVYFLHSNRIMHTDLKPENVVFIDYPIPKSMRVKLIDFGLAVCEEEGFEGTITTRHYRAPEVILQLGWSYPSDVWSIGCILYEMYTGNVLFPKTSKNVAHLAMMEYVLGPIPNALRLSTCKTKYFDGHELNLDEEERNKIYKECKPLGRFASSFKDDKLLFGLISKMLTYEQEDRITCKQALLHPFFDKVSKNILLE